MAAAPSRTSDASKLVPPMSTRMQSLRPCVAARGPPAGPLSSVVAGWRRDGGGLRLYDPADATGDKYKTIELDRGITVEGAVAADINLNGKPDLVVIASRSNNLVWYENRSR